MFNHGNITSIKVAATYLWNHKRLVAVVILLLGTIVGGMWLTNTSWAQTAATQAYFSQAVLKPGVVVSLEEGQTEVVVPASQSNSSRLFGVVVKQTDSNLRLEGAERTTFVTTFGTATTLVTDINGSITAGDSLSISPINGVVQRSTKDEPVLGVALEDFNENSVALNTKNLTDSDGNEVTAHIGLIRVQVKPDQNNSSIIPSFLSSFGESIAGKQVSSFRLFTALAVMVVTLATSSVILFGTIRSAMIAIGRNPLSKRLVYKGLLQVIAIVTIVFIGGVAGAFVILRV